jgi:hypothetical protein
MIFLFFPHLCHFNWVKEIFCFLIWVLELKKCICPSVIFIENLGQETDQHQIWTLLANVIQNPLCTPIKAVTD